MVHSRCLGLVLCHFSLHSLPSIRKTVVLNTHLIYFHSLDETMLANTSLFFLSLAPAIVSAGLLPRWLPIVTLERRADICGVNGYDRNRGNYFWSASKKLASYSGCSARCAGSDRCESFGFNDEVCMLFDLSLAENFDEDRHSDVKYFDVGCIQEDASTSATETTSSSLTRTTTVSTATRTITRSIALATGTGAPLRPTNGTAGFFPLHRTATGSRFPHAPTSSSSEEAATPTPTPDASPVQSPAAEDSGFPELNPDSQIGDGILPPNSNYTFPQNGTSTTVLNGTDTGRRASHHLMVPANQISEAAVMLTKT